MPTAHTKIMLTESFLPSLFIVLKAMLHGHDYTTMNTTRRYVT